MPIWTIPAPLSQIQYILLGNVKICKFLHQCVNYTQTKVKIICLMRKKYAINFVVSDKLYIFASDLHNNCFPMVNY